MLFDCIKFEIGNTKCRNTEFLIGVAAFLRLLREFGCGLEPSFKTLYRKVGERGIPPYFFGKLSFSPTIRLKVLGYLVSRQK